MILLTGDGFRYAFSAGLIHGSQNCTLTWFSSLHWRFMVGIDKIILFPSFSCCLESLARLKFYMPNKSLTVHVSHLFPIYAILALNLSVHTLIVFLSKWTLSGRVVDNYFKILCRPPYLSCPLVLCNLLDLIVLLCFFAYVLSSSKNRVSILTELCCLIWSCLLWIFIGLGFDTSYLVPVQVFLASSLLFLFALTT
jgi:hypothetical protein